MSHLKFEGHAKGAVENVAVEIKDLVIAGWTGRDVTALNHHIEELKAIGGIRSSSRFEMELDDPVRGRKISHAYDIETLPIIA